ncbi:MAG: hypothetical protein KatS3mg068_2174 [Candidatus Sericytochromatia bacterium]|nr:MAG: hypothetical protein KatS3mg068_2174 [Candidatus Sericytochromatia bacterium]
MNNIIYIILPVHNRKDTTINFINNLKKQTYKNFKLILVDDGCEDGTVESVSKIIDDIVILKGNGNLWWAGSLQKAYNYLKKNIKENYNDFVLIINDDTEIEEDFLENGLKIMIKNDKSILQAKGYSLYQKDKCIDSGAFINWKNFTFSSNSDNINCLTTRGLLIKFKDFIDIGGFHPILLPHYASDIEYTFRFYKNGFKLLVDDSFKIFIDDLKTGISINSLYKYNFFYFLKKMFSKKCIDNPITMINLILISCPYKYKIQNILRIIKRTFISILKYNEKR